jgi:acetyltransferase-like isoleucine patch superfamily enzyme
LLSRYRPSGAGTPVSSGVLKAVARQVYEWISAPIRGVKSIVYEIRAVTVFLIIEWPNTPFGNWARKKYWKRKTGVPNIFVGRGANLGDCRQIVFGDNVEIGEHVEFMVDGPPVGYPIFVGSNITIARSVYLRSSNHRFDDTSELIMEQGHVSKKIDYHGATFSVVIEGDSWIGANVIILSGAMIGKGAVIAAGSVVTGAIPPYAIAAGCPARVISWRRAPASHSGKAANEEEVL